MSWIRITCPNGHALTPPQMKRAARTGTCPECHAVVSMWTRVACPNGHALKVRTKHGGQMGKCPQCAASVKIPELSEEALFDLIDAVAGAETKPVHQEAKHDDAGFKTTPSEGDSSLLVGSQIQKRMRNCPKCRAQFSAKYTVCPHCRTILPLEGIASAAEMANRMSAIKCPGCGVPSFPGSHICTNCGMSLVVE